VWKTREHDYVLSEREKGLGYILMCSNTAVTDLVIEAAEASRASDLPLQQIRASAQRLERIGDDLLVLHVQTPRTQTLRFLAGQRATLTLADEASASLPIASCPCEGRHLEFHIRRTPGDRFSELAFAAVKPNGMVTVTGPEGELVLQDDSPRPELFIALDDGFATIKSLIHHAISIDLAESFRLFWLVTRAHGHYLDNLCRSWRDSLENFRYTPIVLPDAGSPGEKVARALAELIPDTPDLNVYDVYVAGPEPLVAAAETFLQGHGLAQERLRSEALAARG
jgi:CDP-4-dehydro-6-deoxyglucose reductase